MSSQYIQYPAYGVISVGSPANGLSISGQTISLALASATTTGALSAADWNTFNSKGGGSVTSVAMTVPAFLSISGSPITTSGTLAVGLSGTALPVSNGGTGVTSLGNLTDVGTDGITVTGGTGALIASASISQHVADTTHNGYLASTDWNTFNSKQNALTLGTVTETTSSVLTLGSWTNATVGSPTITVKQSSGSQSGYLSSTDWTTFNNKQASGNYITALTGDVVASGPGAAASTIQANVVSNSKLAQMATNTIKGNNTGSTANASDLTTAQVAAILPAFVGDSGSGGTQGLVPAPAAGNFPSGYYLSAGGSWTYVDQSKTRNTDFALLSQFTGPSGQQKFENVSTLVYNGKTYALAAGGGTNCTLAVWDITDQTAPTYCSSIVKSGSYNIVGAIQGGVPYGFIASSGASTLIIVNLTNPYNITTTASLTITNSPGSIYSVAYANGYCYLATQNKGLTVVDVGGGLGGGTITVPVQTYQEGGTTNKSFGVGVQGNYVYTTNYQTTFPATVRYLKTWALTGSGTLSVPSLANTYTVPGGPTATSCKPLGFSFSTNGNTVFISDGNQNKVDIVDITTPTSPNYL